MKTDKFLVRHLLMAVLCTCFFADSVFAQKAYTKSGRISFYSKAPLENIEAVNKNVTAILDTKTGMVQFSVLMKGFEFEKALMQEHFNENYVESDKYPKATFSGMVQDNDNILYSKDGTYNAIVKGRMTLHNISKDIDAAGKVIVTNGIPELVADFSLMLADYKITIPSLVQDKISNNVKITVACTLDNVLK